MTMGRNYEETPTFLGYSEREISVLAGGGFNGYGGIMLHEPTEAEFYRIESDPELESTNPKGIGFNYSDVATVTVSGMTKWINWNLDRAPDGRHDVRETGLVRIELFDEAELRQRIQDNLPLLERLGVQFIG